MQCGNSICISPYWLPIQRCYSGGVTVFEQMNLHVSWKFFDTEQKYLLESLGLALMLVRNFNNEKERN